MNDLLTFFRNRQQERGKEWRMKIGLKEGVGFLLFYSNLCLEEDFYQEKLDTADPNLYKNFCFNLNSSIRRNGGGLLIEEKRANDCLLVEINIINSEETGLYDPPQTAFCIEYGSELYEKNLIDGTLRLPLAKDAHIILPVNAEAETHFRSFRQDYSQWFPPDFETNMLLTLRRPSLDLRIARLERIITERAGLTENGTAAFNGDMQSPFTLASWISLGFVIVLLVLSYAYPHLWLALTPTIAAHSHSETQQDSHSGQPLGQSSFSEQAISAKPLAPSSSTVDNTIPKAPTENSDQTIAATKSMSDLQNAIFALVTKLKAKSETDSRLQAILNRYFNQVDLSEPNADNTTDHLNSKQFGRLQSQGL